MDPKISRTFILHRGRVFNLIRQEVMLPNGINMEVDIIRHPGASAIVPMMDHQTLILLEQYRHAIGQTIWEVPAGTLKPNESPLECAKRELEEETGFKASSWESLGEITPLPAYSDERIHVYLATDLSPSRQNLDLDEIVQVRKVSLNQAIHMIITGQIKDGKSISCLMMAALRLGALRPKTD